MASVSSLSSSSSASSIYGSRNVNILSGLASGLDTEGMIEGLIQSYQTKISGYEQDRTIAQWQQTSYQNISNLLVDFDNKYNSYTSSTNLSSPSFFTSTALTETLGQFADAISATGKTSSNILINAVAQLATASTYKTSMSHTPSDATVNGNETTLTGSAISGGLGASMNISDLEGTLSFKYGTKTVSINFDELDFIDSSGNGDNVITAEDLKTAINEKLENVNVTVGSSTLKASDVIGIDVTGNTLSFTDKSDAGNGVTLSSATGKLATSLGLETIEENQSSFEFTPDKYSTSTNSVAYMSGKTMTFTFDGTSKDITIGSDWTADNFTDKLNEELARSFGSGKVTASMSAGNELSFTVGSTSSLSVSSYEIGEMLGFGSDNRMTTYFDSSQTLANLGFTGEQTLEINGVSLGTFGENTTVSSILNSINSNDKSEVRATYSSLTNEFIFTSKETGSGRNIEFGGTLGTALFGDTSDPAAGTFTEGTDAIFSATVNDQEMTLTRSTNTFSLDGLSVSLRDTFNTGTHTGPITDASALTSEELFSAGESVKFSTTADSDLIVDTIKAMVEDYNELVKLVKSEYTDMPLEQSSGEAYLPLTSTDKEGLTETEIANYEEKAKTGILFMDKDLSSLSTELRNAIESIGLSSGDMADIGLTTVYEDGTTLLALDETKLRTAINEEPDKIESVFTNRESYGATYDGLMFSIASVVDKYAATTGEPKGILIEKAGSTHSATSLLQNDMLTEMNEIDEQIQIWTDKMSDKVDYYTAQFTRLEMLINEMNSQSSSFTSMMGG